MSATKWMRTGTVVVLGFFMAMSVVVFAQPATTYAAPKTINLKFAYWMPTKHTLHRVFVSYKKEVEALTNGQVKITLYPGGALGGPLQQWDMALGGITDITFFMPGYTAGRFPLSTVFDLPLIGGGSAKVNTAFAQDVYDRYLTSEYKDAKMLFFFVSEPFTIHTSKKKITTLADFKGLKFRSSGAVQSAMVKNLGGNPVSMPITEVYTSMEKGVIDGVVTAFTAMRAFRLYDVSKYSILAGLTATPMAVAMNKKKFNSLPPAVQKTLEGLTTKYAFISATEYDKDVTKAIQMGRDKGKDVYTLSSATLKRWSARLLPQYDRWASDMNAKGLPGREILALVLQLQGK